MAAGGAQDPPELTCAWRPVEVTELEDDCSEDEPVEEEPPLGEPTDELFMELEPVELPLLAVVALPEPMVLVVEAVSTVGLLEPE
jgi:hypothetical protein